ncbi:MAG: hypothetical protein QXR84_09465 [Candidatus Bathyarchaeia archaeon]
MLNLSSFKDIIVSELKNRLKVSGLNIPVEMLGSEIVLTITRDEIVKQLLSSFPEYVKPYIVVDASDIKIRIKLG